ncbi:hypothetical protein TEA_011631 [Camellia sinensis var. sinensis]|uniref:Uncharacterized protein n=1 Tax=Camellia sinensis var. sinensis TaxID=542762 RepID=A0A4S4CYT4_CAMSN|nr:hypothetical protein TEA_011631 [Camellia sinensis var. sinensis]
MMGFEDEIMVGFEDEAMKMKEQLTGGHKHLNIIPIVGMPGLEVFRREMCSRELEEIGKKIAKECRGLPLSIVVVAGMLADEERRQDRIYSKDGEKSLEDVAEEYLMDLIGRNPILVSVGMYFLNTNTWHGDADVSAEVPRVLVVTPRSGCTQQYRDLVFPFFEPLKVLDISCIKILRYPYEIEQLVLLRKMIKLRHLLFTGEGMHEIRKRCSRACYPFLLNCIETLIAADLEERDDRGDSGKEVARVEDLALVEGVTKADDEAEELFVGVGVMEVAKVDDN